MVLFYVWLIPWCMINLLALFFHIIPNKSWRSWTAKSVLLYLLPLGLIFVMEFQFTTSKEPRLQPHMLAETVWHTPTLQWSDAPLTWAHVSHALLGADIDGRISKDQHRAELEERLAQAQENYAHNLDLAEQGKHSLPVNDRDHPAMAAHFTSLQLRALSSAQNKLEDLYANGPVSVLRARLWEAEIVEQIAKSEHTRTDAAKREARYDLDALDLTSQQGSDALLAVSETHLNAVMANNFAQRHLEWAIQKRQSLLDQAAFAHQSATVTPLPQALEIASAQDEVSFVHKGNPALHPDSLTGPQVSSGLFDIFRKKAPPPHPPSTVVRCYLIFVSGSDHLRPRKTCEIHVPVLINYDLTLAACTPTSSKNCVERWSYPNLTIILTDTDISFLPPRPSKSAVAPASRWEVTLGDVTRPLTLQNPINFSNAVETPARLPRFTLRHLPAKPDQRIRIWSDFMAASATRVSSYLRMSDFYSEHHKFRGASVPSAPLSPAIKHTLRTVWPVEERSQPARNSDLAAPYLNLLARLQNGVIPNTVECAPSLRQRYLEAIISERSNEHLKSSLFEWLTEPDTMTERCVRVKTLVLLYESLWPISPTDVFTR